MKTRLVLVFMVLAILQASYVASAGGDAEEEACPLAGDRDVAILLKNIRQKYRVPAIAGAIVTSKGIVTVGVAGVRKRGTKIAVTLDDRWHLGSDTKAMTATLIAKLVEQGRLKWDTTVAEVFPKLSSKFHRDVRSVTILQLLSHRSGLPANLKLVKYLGDSAPQERLRAVRQELKNSPKTPPGSKYQYSNLGYIIAGAIVEKLTGESWEKNMADHVFGPLKMTHAGFGGLGTPGKIDQPWGHTSDGHPVGKNGPSVDNPPVMGPAGRVHCTIQNWAKFVADHLRGVRGESSILKKSTYTTLHTPPFGGNYALGWIVTKRDWGGGMVLNHGGSNTMNYANVWVAPKRDFAILICVNQGGDAATKASDAAVSALIGYHIAKAKPKAAADGDKPRR